MTSHWSPPTVRHAHADQQSLRNKRQDFVTEIPLSKWPEKMLHNPLPPSAAVRHKPAFIIAMSSSSCCVINSRENGLEQYARPELADYPANANGREHPNWHYLSDPLTARWHHCCCLTGLSILSGSTASVRRWLRMAFREAAPDSSSACLFAHCMDVIAVTDCGASHYTAKRCVASTQPWI
jgi:hypothetical protein